MKWKDRLVVAICIFTIMVCLLFSVGWIVSTLGIYKVDLKILIEALQVIQKFLEFLLGGV